MDSPKRHPTTRA